MPQAHALAALLLVRRCPFQVEAGDNENESFVAFSYKSSPKPEPGSGEQLLARWQLGQYAVPVIVRCIDPIFGTTSCAGLEAAFAT
eukprot:364814-Chlamydomonas_euryale.AAC.16